MRISVLQPVLVLYSIAVIIFMFWLASAWALQRKTDGKPKGYRFVHMMSDASFGIYLIHPLLLTLALKWVVPVLSGPIALRVALTWLMVAIGSAILSMLLVRIPVLSYLVGRGWGIPRWRKVGAVVSDTTTRIAPETKSEMLPPSPVMVLTHHEMDLPDLTATSRTDTEEKVSR